MQALNGNTTGNSNTASGWRSLYSNTTSNYNTASGHQSLYLNTTGSYNIATGNSSLQNNTTGIKNTASGSQSLYLNTTGYYNTAKGNRSLYSNTTGYQNTAVGKESLRYNTTGSNNTVLGFEAGDNITTGSSNIIIGRVDAPSATASNQLNIGNWIYGADGVITMPSQPAFHVNGSPTLTASDIHSFVNIKHNIGSHYVNSTGRFTAPVAGRYLFTAGLWAVANSNNWMQVRINGASDWAGFHVHNTSASSGSVSVVLNLAVNDYVSINCYFAVQGSTPRNYFSGHLIG
jgi:hypothetical protein